MYAAAEADRGAQRDIVNVFEALTQRAYRLNADLVIWPETAIRAPVLRTPNLGQRLFPPTTSSSHLLRCDRNRPRRSPIQHRCRGRLGGQQGDRYRKIRLVPGIESHFTPGSTARPVTVGTLKVGVLICLESVYPNAAGTSSNRGRVPCRHKQHGIWTFTYHPPC